MSRPGETRVPLLPTLFTLGNLMFGFLALAKFIDALHSSTGSGPFDAEFEQHLLRGCKYLVWAMVFDALDGRVARLTNQQSPFGAMLDSLADLVSFGVAPAFLAKITYEHGMSALGLPYRPTVITGFCSLYLICAALRLARFTTDEADDSDHHTFRGLPSPAAAGSIIAACFFIFEGRLELGFSDGAANTLGIALTRSLPYVAAALGLLMISRVRYVHVFQRYIGHRPRVFHLVCLVILFWFAFQFHEWALFLFISIYVVGGLVLGLRAAARGTSPVDALPPPWDPDDGETGDPDAGRSR